MRRKKLLTIFTVFLTVSIISVCGTASPKEEEHPYIQSAVPGNEEKNGLESLDLFIDLTWYYSDNWDGIIPEEIEKATGVTLNVTKTSDAGQLNMMVASGELPDLIFCTGNSLNRLCDSSLCWSYNELISQYGIDWQPDSERIAIAQIHNTDLEDENYYTIIQNYSSQKEWDNFSAGIPGIAGIYYRKDIWEALGSPAMNTTEQIRQVMSMVRENYPDMQVLNAGNAAWRLRGFENWYGISNDFVYLDNKDAVYKDTAPGFYDFAKCINEFYRKGYFTEESLALTVETEAQQLANAGIIYTKINEISAAEKARIYTSATEDEFEASYQDYMQLLEEIGVRQLNDEYNANLQKIKRKFGF